MPLALTDDQMHIIQRMAAPVHPNDRGAYLQTVADLLRGQPLGDGTVSRAAREAQKRFLRPVDINGAGKPSKYR